MKYAILCYHDETAVDGLSQAQDDALMTNLAGLGAELTNEGKLGPSVRLMPTTASTSLRYGGEPLVMDGPFAETKEALLGLYIVDCASLDDAIEAGRRLIGPRVEAGLSGTMEIRPVKLFNPDRRSA